MDKSKLVRYLNGRSSKEEELAVLNWLNRHEAGEELDQLFEEVWELSNTTPQTDIRKKNLLVKINQKIKDKSRPTQAKKSIFLQLKVAAVWLILIGFLAVTLKVIWDNKPIEKELIAEINWIERIVLPGEKLRLILPDKSQVLVNSDSKIRFPSSFGQKSREVYLEGEAFFEVKKEKGRPFKVHAGEMTAEVLGTSFNIVSRFHNNRVALFEGKVKISSASENTFLSPGEMVEYVFDNNIHLHVHPFIYQNEMAWKEGQIKFQNESLQKILQKLEQWYGVTFILDSELKINRTVTGTFNNDNLDNVLTGLGFTLNFKHSIQNKSVKLKSL
ncbi:FecR family protein [Cyclobacterium qasimii]|uniref:FecR family protein n=1 Tax=Cyclobacterium qasimii TaxID=1350429 RepID=UPI0011BF47B8|nr:FecR domain-containing protein [Cyclobacterium qasimii]